MEPPGTPGSMSSPTPGSGHNSATPILNPASPAPHFASVEEASPSALKVFTCCRCTEECDIRALSGGLKNGELPPNPTELTCSANYKALTRRWRKDTRLKTAWDAKGKDERIAWYQAHKRIVEKEGKLKGGSGVKRKMELVQTTAQNKYATTESRQSVMWRPYSQYAKEKRMMGMADEVDILQAWRQELMDPRSRARKINDEWHIGEYLGVQENVIQGSSLESTMSSQRGLATKDEVQAALADVGRELAAQAVVFTDEVFQCLGAPLGDSAVDDKWVRGVVERNHPFENDLCQGFLQEFETHAQIQQELEALFLEEELEASKYEKPKAPTSDKTMLKLDVERYKAKVIGKMKWSCDEATPELEGVLDHISSKEAADNDDIDLSNMLEQAKVAVKALAEGVKTCEIAVNAKFNAFEETIKEAGPAEIDVDIVKKSFDEAVRDVMGPQGALAQVKKLSSGLRSLVARRRARLERDAAVQKSKLACVDFELVGVPGTSNAEYVMNAIWAPSGKKEVNVVSTEAGWQKGQCTMFTDLSEVGKAIVENKGFVTFAKWFKGMAATRSSAAATSTGTGSSASPRSKAGGTTNERSNTFTASVSHPTLQREVSKLLSEATPLGKKVMSKKLFMAKEHVDMGSSLYQLQHYSHGAGYYSVNPTAFGMAEGHFIVSGQVFLIGIPIDLKTGSLADLLGKARTISGPELGKLCKTSKGFMVALEANSMVLVLAGHVVLTWVPKFCAGFRWGLSNLDLPDEDARILPVVTALLSMYPVLSQSRYGVWKDYLNSST